MLLLLEQKLSNNMNLLARLKFNPCRQLGIVAVSLPFSLEGEGKQNGFGWSKVGIFYTQGGEIEIRVENLEQRHPDPTLDISTVT